MPQIEILANPLKLELPSGKYIQGMSVNTGVPHFVLELARDPELAKQIRKHKSFGKAGTNVTFLEKHLPGHLFAVTYERGVEGFTNACGTGAVAASAFSQQKNGMQEQIVEMPGGELKIRCDDSGLRPSLTGDAKIDFQAEAKIDG